ncbi:hypothetical protein BHE90_004541 [Fusarium euwallaceae]|uniref:Uncharacterized protein n=3 Tax=Fusarium solani species complex TaxID=232080 RepID=A0A3M2SBH9_9HYPO|nr:hypothetical protein CDV36_005756 [Fusarium kuroshium]RSL87712.1 hypothetical protein CEP51_002076 [Fusarium floridanum]RTE80938.1 hypothetical protein BHE90_004541 [Fusarium euwallaceae]
MTSSWYKGGVDGGELSLGDAAAQVSLPGSGVDEQQQKQQQQQQYHSGRGWRSRRWRAAGLGFM